MRQMNIHDDEIGVKGARFIKHHASVRHRARFMPMRPQQIAKKLEVEFVVLDNKNAFRHLSPGMWRRAAALFSPLKQKGTHAPGR